VSAGPVAAAWAEELARVSGEAGVRMLVDENPQPVCVFSPESLEILAFNDAAPEFYGYTRDEFARLSITELAVPEDAAAFATEVARVPGVERSVGHYRHRRKDGTERSVHVVTHELALAGRRARLAIVTDVSDRAVLQAQLRQAQKMGAVGQLASSVAHDFNNLLTAIMTSVELAGLSLEAESTVHAELEVIDRAARRAADLTRQLLTFSRKRPPTPEVLDLNALIAGPVQLLRRLVGVGVELRVLPAPNLWPVRADAGQMEQVLLNLVVNARDAMPDGGMLVVTTANRLVDEAVPHLPGLAPGEYVALVVRDTGEGMDAATLARVFEPFFTTKPAGQGTGLGLSTVYGIVKQWGGYVYGESTPGAGTEFSVLLPRIVRA
jgi:PAS domain S-box-containing protein